MKNKKVWTYILLILSLILNLIYVFWINEYLEWKINENKLTFNVIQNYNISNKNDIVIQKVDKDIRWILKKYFWKIKLNKNIFLKDKDSYHLFYFSEKNPNLNIIISNVSKDIEKLRYTLYRKINNRTYEYKFNLDNKKYSLVFHVLSYNLWENDDFWDNVWMFMLYIKKYK